MTCPRCGKSMKLKSHRPHKQEKWVCPKCRKVRMKPAKYKRRKNRSHGFGH